MKIHKTDEEVGFMDENPLLGLPKAPQQGKIFTQRTNLSYTYNAHAP